ncbi:MAG: hypothetical protein ACREQQ_02660 [Candidatus Binatia bacterium]
MSYDLKIRGATLNDGSGRPPFTGDVGIRDGAIVAVGHADDPATRTIAAEGLAAAPPGRVLKAGSDAGSVARKESPND